MDENQDDRDSGKQDKKKKNSGESEGSDVKDNGKVGGKKIMKMRGLLRGQMPS